MKRGIKITAIAVLLLIAGTGITKAQQGRMAGDRRANPLNFCMNIPDLTDSQKEKIAALNDEHRKQMDQLREERINATDLYARNEIAAKMLLQQNEHMKNLESQLTDSQKKYFRENITDGRPGYRANRGFNRGPGQGNGYRAGWQGNGRGFHRGEGRGYGAGCPRFRN